MHAIDFEYDGQYLSDYGFIICDFKSNNGANEVNAGSVITFNKVSHYNGRKYSLSSAQYDECISASFDICKNPDIFDSEDMEITSDEYRDVVKWLNRREFLKFKLLDDIDDFEKDNCFYNASFNIKKIIIGDKLYGINLTMETDSPFGYGETERKNLDFVVKNSSKTLDYNSDEIGYIYPKIVIICMQDGTLNLCNHTEPCNVQIKNCEAGEVITLHGDTNIITTERSEHDICKDFNYDFFKIGNTFGESKNVISSSLCCSTVVTYNPIIKDSLI